MTRMLQKLLIANRGEIAARIIRTCRRLGVDTVLAVSEADRSGPAAADADDVVLVGPPPAAESYLRQDRLIEAALRTSCNAIHPGYGFLSENAGFAEAVIRAGLIFVGPSPAAMRSLGSKASAKALASSCGVPVVPGYQGETQDAATLLTEARQLGFPVLLKAVDGGGGRGMRRVDAPGDLPAALDSARREALAAFGSDRMLVEKLIEHPRHIEVQVFGDSHGNVVHLFERDCSLQRRNQKVVEEAPAPGLAAQLRARMTAAAVSLTSTAGYENAGTVEFLVEGCTEAGGRTMALLPPDQPFHFIEMNTRLQVEHPVTEAITGLDLVEWQLRVASGERLPLLQDEIAISGHAIEVRLNAEDPASGFLPSTGTVAAISIEGPGIRCDTGVAQGSVVSTYYDSLLAKIIGHAPTRRDAIDKVARALREGTVAGPTTNGAFLLELLGDKDVVAGRLETGLIGRKIDALTASQCNHDARTLGIALAARRLLDGRRAKSPQPPALSPWDASDAFQLGCPRRLVFPVVVDGMADQAEANWSDGNLIVAYRGTVADARAEQQFAGRLIEWQGDVFAVHDMHQALVSWPKYDIAGGNDEASPSDADHVLSPINGRIVEITVTAGQSVDKGARVAVVEAMKMEHVVIAPRQGLVTAVMAEVGAQLAQGAVIATLEPVAASNKAEGGTT